MDDIRIKNNPVGGNVVFVPGKGYNEPNGVVWPNGSFVFMDPTNLEREFMRIDPDGKVTVRGEQVATNLAIWEGFREWVISAGIYRDAASLN